MLESRKRSGSDGNLAGKQRKCDGVVEKCELFVWVVSGDGGAEVGCEFGGGEVELGDAEGVNGEGRALGAVDGPEYNAGDGGEEDEGDDEDCCPEAARAEAAALAAAGGAVYGAGGMVELSFVRWVCSAVGGGRGRAGAVDRGL